MSIWDEIEADDAARLATTRREIAAEKAAWDALTPEQQAAHTAAVEAKFGDVLPECHCTDDHYCSCCDMDEEDEDD